MAKKILAWTLKASAFALTYVINPAYLTACGDASEEPEQDGTIEAELLAELDRVDQVEAFTFVSDKGESYELTLQLAQAQGDDVGEVSLAPRLFVTAQACGTRTFFQSASACATTYELALEGTLSLRKLDESSPLLADVPVEGRLSNYGELSLNIDGDAANSVSLGRGTGDTYSVWRFTASNIGPEMLDIMSAKP